MPEHGLISGGVQTTSRCGVGGWRGGLQWKQESKPWKLWSALKALGLVTGIRGSEQGAGAKVLSSRTTVGHPRGGEGRAAAGNSVAGEAETTGRPLGGCFVARGRTVGPRFRSLAAGSAASLGKEGREARTLMVDANTNHFTSISESNQPPTLPGCMFGGAGGVGSGGKHPKTQDPRRSDCGHVGCHAVNPFWNGRHRFVLRVQLLGCRLLAACMGSPGQVLCGYGCLDQAEKR